MSWAGTPLQLSQSKTYFSTYFSSSLIGTRKYCHKSETSTCSGEISSISSRVRPFADVMSDLTIQSLHLRSMDSRTPPRMLTLPWYTYEPPPISVVAAKTKVSPLKRQSIPRLELYGANLLAKLLIQVRSSPNIDLDHTFAWSDSTIVLQWLDGSSKQFKTYVGNRISNI